MFFESKTKIKYLIVSRDKTSFISILRVLNLMHFTCWGFKEFELGELS